MTIREITQREEDGAIQFANQTGIVPGARETVHTTGHIGDGAYGTTSGDMDYYNVYANAGDIITAEIHADNFGETLDPVLVMFDATGTQVAYNDDFDGRDSLVQYTVATSGSYSILARGFSTTPTSRFDPATGTLNNDTAANKFGNYDLYVNVNNVDHNASSTSGNDTITANATDSLINGRNGNDTITGGAGDDVLDGGIGSDTVDGGGGNNTLIWTWDGTAQTDHYLNTGSGGALEVHGGTGGDIILGDGSSNFLTMSNNSLSVGALGRGTIRLFSESGDDVVDIRANPFDPYFSFELFGGAGDDTLYGRNIGTSQLLDGGNGIDQLIGGSITDILRGGAGDDTEHGNGGNDLFQADLDPGDDILFGDAGIDTVSFASLESAVNVDFTTNRATSTETGTDYLFNIENATGGLGGDTFTPGNGVNVIDGGAGTDTLDFSGYAGYLALNMDTNVHSGTLVVGDTYTSIENVIGGAGDDYIAGDHANNRYEGGAGNDTLQGRWGEDTLIGGGGDDRLFGGGDDDLLQGGAGADAFFGGDGTDFVSYDGSARVDISLKDNTASSNDAVGDSFDSIESVSGGYGDDYIVGDTGENSLIGNGGNDSLYGWTGNDYLLGNAGNDRLFGGAGNDVIAGGTGNDTLYGNGDADFFIFNDDYGTDAIKDFENGSDIVSLGAVTNIVDYADLTANHLTYNGAGDAVITDGTNVLTVEGLTAALLDATDFTFTPSI